jgi:hypothetical protein
VPKAVPHRGAACLSSASASPPVRCTAATSSTPPDGGSLAIERPAPQQAHEAVRDCARKWRRPCLELARGLLVHRPRCSRRRARTAEIRGKPFFAPGLSARCVIGRPLLRTPMQNPANAPRHSLPLVGEDEPAARRRGPRLRHGPRCRSLNWWLLVASKILSPQQQPNQASRS